jgi:hypothetical protein
MPEVTVEELLAPLGKRPKSEPLLSAIRELQEAVGGNGRVEASAYDVPLEFFSHPCVRGCTSYVSGDGKSTWIGGVFAFGGHEFYVYSNHFPTTESTPES